MSQRYKLVLEYDGTDLLGWQKQLDGPSVQEYVEKQSTISAVKKPRFMEPAARMPVSMHWDKLRILTQKKHTIFFALKKHSMLTSAR